MKHLRPITAGLAAGLMFSLAVRAGDLAMAGNPYTPIVVRNVFGLNPPPTNNPADNATPPPKITLTGIMSSFGELQALYKVAPIGGKPGAKEESYILSEGQRQDDVEVRHIDDKAGVVTFENHGTVQDVPLANAPTISSPAPGPVQPGGLPRPFPAPGYNPAAGSPGTIPTRFGGGGPRGRGPTGVNNMGSGGAGMPGSAFNGAQPSQANQETPQMSPEENAIWIEAQRVKYQNEGNPAARILPPTALTQMLNEEGNQKPPPMP